MSTHFIKVKKRQLKKCLSCPLCSKLLKEATTICECLHTFCRKCIYERLVEEENNSCPICDVYLGCLPAEKLRPDNNLQDVRTKIFPGKKKKMKAAENIPQIPARRKERSLSSIVISTPPVSAQAGQSSRKVVSRRSIGSKGISSKANGGKATEFTQEQLDKLDSTERPRKQRNLGSEQENQSVEDNKQNVTLLESHQQQTGKSSSWDPLECLVEAATNRTENSMPTSALPSVKLEDYNNNGIMKCPNIIRRRSAGAINLARRKELLKTPTGSNPKVPEKTQTTVIPKLAVSKKRKHVTGSVESAPAKNERRNNPVWFALLASDKQPPENALPQIPKSYLRIKDGNVPVSYIKKYLVKKLNLRNEYEVEITCCGQPIVPSLSLYSLVDFWLQYAASADRLPAILESESGKGNSNLSFGNFGPNPEEFMMVLIYGKKTARST